MAGGLGMVVVGASMIFRRHFRFCHCRFSAAIGSVMIKNMSREGYDKAFAAGLVAAAGTIGIIIPPSIPMLIYGFVGNVSVADLFHWGHGAWHTFRRLLHGRVLLCWKINQLRPRRPNNYPQGADQSSFIGTAPALFMPVADPGRAFSPVGLLRLKSAALAVIYGLLVTTVDLSRFQASRTCRAF